MDTKYAKITSIYVQIFKKFYFNYFFKNNNRHKTTLQVSLEANG